VRAGAANDASLRRGVRAGRAIGEGVDRRHLRSGAEGVRRSRHAAGRPI